MIAAAKKLIARAALKVGHAMSEPVHQRGYDGAKSSRLNADWLTGGRTSSVDELTPSALTKLRARSQDLERNNDVARGFYTLLDSNVLGDGGLRLSARVRSQDGTLDDERGNAIEAAWQDWGTHHADVAGVLSWRDIQALVLRGVARDGGALVRLIRGAPDNPYRFAVQVLEASAIDLDFSRKATGTSNEIVQGVERDEWGRVTAYHLHGNTSRVRLSARELIYVRRQERPSAVHSAPWMASCMASLRMLSAYQESVLVHSRIAASACGIVTRASNGDGFPAQQAPDGSALASMEPGSLIQLPDGTSFSAWEPSGQPAQGFESFSKGMLRQISASLGCSFHALGQDAESVNFSSLRAFTLFERDNYAVLQTWLAHQLAGPCFKAFQEMATLAGKIKAEPVEWKFHGRRWQWVDPLREGTASINAIAAGIRSRRQVVADAGGADYQDTLKEIAADNAAAAALGLTFSETGIAEITDDESD